MKDDIKVSREWLERLIRLADQMNMDVTPQTERKYYQLGCYIKGYIESAKEFLK